ncbi:MAG: hypothetical protein NUW08_03905, partial [Candidatus Uhrbacteria bacterium]|nr:hypothetical protein [Candidatus Uhrbacteria bacterium]
MPITADTLLSARYLEIKVRRTGTTTFDTLSPRVRLSHSPFAVVADTIDGIDSSNLAMRDAQTGVIVGTGLSTSASAPTESGGPATIRFSGTAWEFTNDGVNYSELGAQTDLPASPFVATDGEVVLSDPNNVVRVDNDVTVNGALNLGAALVFDSEASATFSSSVINAGSVLSINAENPNGSSHVAFINNADGGGVNVEIDGGLELGGALSIFGDSGQNGQVLVSGGAGDPPSWSNLNLVSSQWTTSGSNISYSGGNVGIRTASPAAPLHIRYGSANTNVATPAFIIENPSGGTQATMQFWTNGVENARIRGDIFNNLVFTAKGGSFWFDNATQTVAFIHGPTGNLGLGAGNINPTAQLDVNGDADISGDVFIGGSALIANGADIDGILNLVPTTALPETGVAGDLAVFDGTLWLSDGFEWVDLGALGGGSSNFVEGFDTAAVFSLVRANTSEGSQIPVFAGDTLGQLAFGGYDGFQYSSGGAGIIATATENWSDTANGVAMQITTVPNGSVIPTPRITIASEGFVGIQTTEPQYTLDVGGDLNVTGQILQQGIPITTGGGGSSPWFDNETFITYEFGNVGIGTSSPAETLDVNGTGQFFTSSGYALRLAGDSSGAGYLRLTETASNTNWDMIAYSSGLSFNNSGVLNNALHIQNTTGNVGIGTASPAHKLDVVGDINFSGTLLQNGSPVSLGGGSSPWIDNETFITYEGGNVGIGTSSPSTLLQLGSTANFQDTIARFSTGNGSNNRTWDVGVPGGGDGGEDTSGSNYSFIIDDTQTGTDPELLINYASGFVGLGVLTPLYRLDVAGDINFTGTLYQNGSPFTGGAGSWGISGSDVFFDGGKVGIGTTAPEKLLQVGSNSGSQDSIARFAAGDGSNARTFDIGVPFAGTNAYDFIIDDVTGGPTPEFVIDFITENVGIGLTDPAYKLDVAGDINFTGSLLQNGSPFSAGGSLWTDN